MVRTVWKVWCAGIWPGIRAGRDDGEAMLIALLAILGVDLIVIVAFAAFVLGRRRWLKRQPGEFAGAIPGVRRRRRRPEPEVEARFRPLGPRCPGLEQGAADVPQ
jgi:hypothetical protein